MWEIRLNNADWDCFKTPILRETLKTRNQHQEDSCAIFGSHTFVPMTWMCMKQASVSHSSTSGDNFPWCRFTHGWYSRSWSLGFGCKSVPFFPKTNSTTPKVWMYKETCRITPHQTSTPQNQTKVQTQHDHFNLKNVDCVPRSGAMLYVFEDNEAVI